MGGHCELATLQTAHAYWTGTGVLITARGTVPESCWDVTIKRNLLTVDPPEFVMEGCRTSVVCLTVETPYFTATEFETGSEPEHVVLHHGGGQTNVPLEPIPTSLEGVATSAATAGEIKAVGFSLAFSFEEALDNALRKLVSEDLMVPVDVKVESIQAGMGGVLGRYLAVTVKPA